MKQNWEYKKLGDVCVSELGKTLNQSKDTGSLRPYLCAVNVQWDSLDFTTLKQARFEEDELERYSVQKNDLLVCEGGDVGRAAIWNQEKPMLYQNALHRLRFSNNCNPRFYLFCLKHLKNKGVLDSRYAKGVTIKHLVKSALLSIQVPILPLEEQSRIVAELDLLTGIIDKQNAQFKELDNLAQAIFYDMFGDPIENPKRWEVKKLGDVSTSVSYGTSSPSTTVGKYKYLRMNNITYEGFLDLTDLKYIDMDDAEFEKYSVREGDVLFNRTNSMDLIGKTTYIHNMEPMIIAGYIIRVRLVDSVLPVYVSKFMNMPAMKKKLKGMAKGAVNQANINSKELKSIDIPVPPLALQQSFAEKIQSIEKQKVAIRASIADTQKLLDYTMDKYFG